MSKDGLRIPTPDLYILILNGYNLKTLVSTNKQIQNNISTILGISTNSLIQSRDINIWIVIGYWNSTTHNLIT